MTTPQYEQNRAWLGTSASHSGHRPAWIETTADRPTDGGDSSGVGAASGSTNGWGSYSVTAAARRLHLHRRLAEPDHVSGSEPHGRLDPVLVDPRAVERVEILDLDRTIPRAHERVPARDLRIVDDDVRVSAPQHELGLDDEFVA